MVDNDRSADIVRPATIIEGSSSHALLDFQTDQETALDDNDSSFLAQARRKIEVQKSRGYSFALIYMTADEKDAAVENDAFADLREEGYSVYPGVTPDYTLFERGVAACEFIKIVWPQTSLPDWALPAKTSSTKKERAAKKPRKTKSKKARKATGNGTPNAVADTTDDAVMTDAAPMSAQPKKKGKARRKRSP